MEKEENPTPESPQPVESPLKKLKSEAQQEHLPIQEEKKHIQASFKSLGIWEINTLPDGSVSAVRVSEPSSTSPLFGASSFDSSMCRSTSSGGSSGFGQKPTGVWTHLDAVSKRKYLEAALAEEKTRLDPGSGPFLLLSHPAITEEHGQTAKLESISAMPAYNYERYESEKSVMASCGFQADVKALQEALAAENSPVTKKGGAVKTGTNKKVDGGAQLKASKLVEPPEDVEPTEMTLEEIETRIGSLIQSDTITLLKSAVWKERLEAISSLKQQVEGLPNLDQSVEILIRLLCTLPGWAEKNVQVQQQVIEVITRIASTATKFPKKCVVLCLSGLSERVADIKTRTHAMKCLATFCKAVGPRFVFERVSATTLLVDNHLIRLYKIMKEHKNPQVLSEGMLWMAVGFGGISGTTVTAFKVEGGMLIGGDSRVRATVGGEILSEAYDKFYKPCPNILIVACGSQALFEQSLPVMNNMVLLNISHLCN